jgi:hypothetical protein
MITVGMVLVKEYYTYLIGKTGEPAGSPVLELRKR